MICPACKREGKTSRVYYGNSSHTSTGAATYFDETGVFHSHDDTVRVTKFHCSQGHHFKESLVLDCPAPGCATFTGSRTTSELPVLA